jgi:DNA-binding CsgD family transcriptional regulator
VGAVFGREQELSLADSFLERTGERFGVLVLEGESGIGKTTIWREVVRRANQRGIRVLSCRPAEAETKLALSALADLLAPVPSDAFATLPEPQWRALDVALLRAEPRAARLDRRTLGTGLRSLLAELSAQQALLVAVDDVQWLDASSATVLGFALRRLVDERVGWLLARRLSAPARLVADGLVGGDEFVTRHTIGPLTLAAVHHLLKEHLDRALSRPALVRVHEASGGNPLFALEIARELDPAAAAEPGPRLAVPERLRDLLARRIPTLAMPAREALLAAAALSQPTAELVELASSPDGLAAAEETALLRVKDGRVTFAHPLYASAVYRSASRRRRRALHRRLARLVTDPEERARHLAVATTEPDESVAAMLEQGAALARARGAWESAAELLERASGLTPPDRLDVAAARGIAAAEHHVHAGDRRRGRELLEGILARPLPPLLRADALRVLAEITYNDENAIEARRLFSQALQYADEPRLAATIELGLSYVSGHLADQPSGVVHAYRALDRAQATRDRSLVAEALGLCAAFDFLCGRGVDWDKVERSLALEDPDSITPLLRHPTTVAAMLLLYVGRHAEARERLAAVRTAAGERGDESDLAFVLLWVSWLETRSGNLAAAAAAAEEGDALAALTGSRSTHANLLAQRALMHAHRGAIAETRRDCAEAAALLERLGAAWVGVWIAAALGLLELSLGNPRAAWEACERATEAVERQGIAEPVPLFFLPDALEALIGLGQLDRGEALLDAFERRGRELDRAWALATAGRCRGLLLAARGDLAGAAAALQRALADHERLDMPFEFARTLLVKGLVDRRARRRADAKASLERALAIFERIGARIWIERTRRELDRVGLRRSAGDELTAGERAVAELAAQGLTNREVASTLFVSPKTVEANLARVYRKLGIASRAELGGRMAGSVRR